MVFVREWEGDIGGVSGTTDAGMDWGTLQTKSCSQAGACVVLLDLQGAGIADGTEIKW